MRILFESSCLMPEKISGVGVYAKNLFLALKKAQVDVRPVITWSRIHKESFLPRHIGQKGQMFGPIALPNSQTVFHGPDFRLPAASSVYPRAVTVHDLAVFHLGFNAEPFRERGQVLMDQLMRQKPDHVFVPSQFVAHEVQERYPHMMGKVSAIHHGADHLLQENAPIPAQGNYFLYVGHIEHRKNVHLIIQAFEIFAEKNEFVHLVLVGKPGFRGEEIMEQAKNSRFHSRIDIRGFVTGDELAGLYAGAKAFLFPSRYEGFGFPIIEAMGLGCPVITTNHGTMKEVAGGCALLVDMNSAEDLSVNMNRVLEDSERQSLIAKGKAHAGNFTWKIAAQAYKKIYTSLI